MINLLKGLDFIGQKYILNRNVKAYEWNWIHDSIDGLIEVAVQRIPAVLGPNIVVWNSDFPIFCPKLHTDSIYLHPSTWPLNMWKQLGFRDCKLKSWPVGIDISAFKIDKNKRKKENVLIYYKGRQPCLLAKIVEEVIRLGYKPKILVYGHYSEEFFKIILEQCIFGIWVGSTESQGIALEEAMASDLPLIVLDCVNLNDCYPPGACFIPKQIQEMTATSIPYFSEKCGIRILSISELELAIETMAQNINSYNPSQFVQETLSLELCAKKFVSFFLDINRTPGIVQVNVEKEFTKSFTTGTIIKFQKYRKIIDLINHGISRYF